MHGRDLHRPDQRAVRHSRSYGGLDRIRYRYYERVNYKTRTLRLPILRRQFPDGLQPYGGGAWCALSHAAVRYISSFVEQRPDVVRFFKHVKIPDEIFVQTILMNSPLRDTVVGCAIALPATDLLWPRDRDAKKSVPVPAT